jgi:hypothetical protein
MSKGFKITLLIFAVVIVAGGIIAYKMFTKPRRDVANEKGIAVSAAQLVSEFQQNEAQANAKYLNKPVEVTGTVADVQQNQDGKTTVLLSSNDAMAGVFCTLKQSDATIAAGASITIKGICHGMLSDVRLGESIVVK